MSKRYSKEEQQSFYDKWRASGQSKTVFCHENKVSTSAFYKWLRSHKKQDSSNSNNNKTAPLNFLPIKILNKSPEHTGISEQAAKEIEILLPNGIAIKTRVASVGKIIKELML